MGAGNDRCDKSITPFKNDAAISWVMSYIFLKTMRLVDQMTNLNAVWTQEQKTTNFKQNLRMKCVSFNHFALVQITTLTKVFGNQNVYLSTFLREDLHSTNKKISSHTVVAWHHRSRKQTQNVSTVNDGIENEFHRWATNVACFQMERRTYVPITKNYLQKVERNTNVLRFWKKHSLQTAIYTNCDLEVKY